MNITNILIDMGFLTRCHIIREMSTADIKKFKSDRSMLSKEHLPGENESQKIDRIKMNKILNFALSMSKELKTQNYNKTELCYAIINISKFLELNTADFNSTHNIIDDKKQDDDDSDSSLGC
jgi:hypothetical protein